MALRNHTVGIAVDLLREDTTLVTVVWPRFDDNGQISEKQPLGGISRDKTPAMRKSWSTCLPSRNEANKSILHNGFLSWEVKLLKMFRDPGYHSSLTTRFCKKRGFPLVLLT